MKLFGIIAKGPDAMITTECSPHGFRTDWQSFKTASLDISLYNTHQQGLNLAGLCHWISQRYDDCIINLGDTLHRHNLRHVSSSVEEAHKLSVRLGDEWIAENEPYLKWLTIPHKIVRHDDWLHDPDFKAIHTGIWCFYNEDPDFQRIIKEDIETFTSRQDTSSPDEIRKGALSYLLEELSADILLGRRMGVAHFYPAWRQKCYGHLVQRTQEIPDVLRGLENSAFKRYSPGKLRLLSSETASFKNAHEERQSAA